jgi:hypothetical protein
MVSDGQQNAEIAVAMLGDAAKPFLAPPEK